jgi:hypothetical protein
MSTGVARGDGRRFFTRLLAAVALIAFYCLSTVGMVVATGSEPAFARGRGGGRGGGGRGGGRGIGRGRGGGVFRGRGRGRGRGIGIYYGGYYDGCWWSPRYQRWVCPYY